MARRGATKVQIGDAEYTVPPLSLGVMRELTRAGHFQSLGELAEVAAKGAVPSPEQLAAQVDAAIAVISAALSMKHKECTQEWVAENVAVDEAAQLLAVVLTAAGVSGGNASPNAVSP